MTADNDVTTHAKLNYTQVAQIILICVLLAIFVFGIACVCSKFISSSQSSTMTVFNKTVMEITDDLNSPEFVVGDRVVITKTNQFSIGDFVVLNTNSNLPLSSNLLMEIVGIDTGGDEIIFELRQGTGNSVNTTSEYIFGKVTSNSGFTYSFVLFLLSDWPLWLFVVFPCVVLIAILIFYCIMRIKGQQVEDSLEENDKNDEENFLKENNNNNEENPLEENHNKNKEDLAKENNKKIKNKESKNINSAQGVSVQDIKISSAETQSDSLNDVSKIQVSNIKDEKTKQSSADDDGKKQKSLKIGDAEQLTFDLENLDKEQIVKEKGSKSKTKKSEPVPPILQDLRAYKQKNNAKQKAQKPKPKLYLHHKPKNDKRDDYVFKSSGTEDTNTKIKQMLKRYDESTDSTNGANELLNKMRKEANKNDGE